MDTLGEALVATRPTRCRPTVRWALGWNPTHPSLLADLENLRP